MNLGELAARIDARLIPSTSDSFPEVKAIHAADTISSLIANASAETLLVTSLNNSQLIRVAELMDAPGLCLVGGAQPSSELITRARETGASILVSPLGLEEARDLLEACLEAAKQVRA
jgi:hypothetical protein